MKFRILFIQLRIDLLINPTSQLNHSSHQLTQFNFLLTANRFSLMFEAVFMVLDLHHKTNELKINRPALVEIIKIVSLAVTFGAEVNVLAEIKTKFLPKIIQFPIQQCAIGSHFHIIVVNIYRIFNVLLIAYVHLFCNFWTCNMVCSLTQMNVNFFFLGSFTKSVVSERFSQHDLRVFSH